MAQFSLNEPIVGNLRRANHDCHFGDMYVPLIINYTIKKIKIRKTLLTCFKDQYHSTVALVRIRIYLNISHLLHHYHLWLSPSPTLISAKSSATTTSKGKINAKTKEQGPCRHTSRCTDIYVCLLCCCCFFVVYILELRVLMSSYQTAMILIRHERPLG